MQKISPHLWYDKEAKEAAQFYTSAFKNSRITNTITLPETPSGSVDVVDINLEGHDFTLISAGPLFKFNPSISFLVMLKTKEEVDELWAKLSPGGTPLMPLDAYPFSEHYGWIQDRYGLSWQLMYAGNRPFEQKITPVLMYTEKVSGKAEEAIRFYTSVFRNAKSTGYNRYSADEKPEKEGTVKFGTFVLEGQEFAAMDSVQAHGFAFNEAISLLVRCDTQKDIDDYWNELSADPKAEQCGWLKDKYGVSWQVVPTVMDEMMAKGTQEQIDRVTEAFLKMKKFDIAKLEQAYKSK